MSDKTDDGGPAFPWHQSPGNQNNLGMSLRDWFAGQSMNGIVGHPFLVVLCGGKGYEGFAQECYRVADAMLAARKERHDT